MYQAHTDPSCQATHDGTRESEKKSFLPTMRPHGHRIRGGISGFYGVFLLLLPAGGMHTVHQLRHRDHPAQCLAQPLVVRQAPLGPEGNEA